MEQKFKELALEFIKASGVKLDNYTYTFKELLDIVSKSILYGYVAHKNDR